MAVPEPFPGAGDKHYEVEKILQSHLMPNKKGIQYLVKWLGYPNSENSWEPVSNLKNSPDLVVVFHKCYPKLDAQTPQNPGAAGAVA